jgi:hypothetical protein
MSKARHVLQSDGKFGSERTSRKTWLSPKRAKDKAPLSELQPRAAVRIVTIDGLTRIAARGNVVEPAG